jgi:galactose oxidase
MNGAVMPSNWQTAVPTMHDRRYQGNVVILPTGDLFAIGGQPALGSFNLVPEMLVGGTQWTQMAPHIEPRDYHSAAILLPDASVFVCGGENRRTLNPSGKDYAIWAPPYFQLDYGSVPPTGIIVQRKSTGATIQQDQVGAMTYDDKFRASWTNTLEPGIQVASVVLMRPAAMTHHDDGGQRMVRLLAWDDGTVPPGFVGSIMFHSPTTIQHAAPGWWMLFLVTSAGRPSQAYWIHLA